MFRLQEIKRFLVLGIVAFFATAMLASAAPASAAGVRGLTATIDTEQSFVESTGDAVVRFTLRNDSDEDLYILSWQTPFRGVVGNLFDVRKGGQPVAYTGRLYKRGTPQAADYLRIPAGQSLSAEVELSSVYDLRSSGEYSVQYSVRAQDLLASDLKALTRNIDSNTVFLAVERPAEPFTPDFDEVLAAAAGKALVPAYVSCSSSRQSTLVTALSNAESISLKARNDLNNLATASRSTDAAYRTWFGAYTSSRYSSVQSHYTSINSAFSTKLVTFFCDCTDSAYAYVFSNRPYEIHLCNAFWNAPASGIDSKAGTLVHEMSHFDVTAGTSDWVYGVSGSQNLAITDPSRATDNADNHEYYAEDRTP